MPFLFVATMSSLLYLLCLKLGSMDFFQYLISKMGFSLGSRVLLSRGLGCEGWLLLVLILAAFGIFDGTIMKMTGENETIHQGPHRGDAGPSSTPSTSSTWSGSWIERWLNQEASSSAPNAVMEETGPSQIAPPDNSSTGLGPEEQQAFLLEIQAGMKLELQTFLRSFTKIEPKFNFVSKVSEDLDIDHSDLPKLQKMKEVMDVLRQCEGIQNGSKAANLLKAAMKEWEKNGRT